MFRKKKDLAEEALLPVPTVLPSVEGLEQEEKQASRSRPRTWLWTFIAALVAVSLLVYVLVLGALGIYEGLKDRALENQRIAQEHYALGLAQLQAKEYEKAIGEFTLALRHDASLQEARDLLREAEELARAQATPTSETRRDAAELLYRQAVAHYESGTLEQAVVVLDELRGLDADYQRENVQTMLVTAHYQLGLNAVIQDRMNEAAGHFEAVLVLDPENKDAQDQLNLVHLYTAAMSNWDRDWSAAIQGLKGLYALAPGYKDVQARLHDAYTLRAEEHTTEGDWCQAADEYAAAVEVLPLEETVDLRDDARIRCQATAEAPTPTLTAQPRPTTRPTATAAAGAQPTPTPTGPAVTAGSGRIAFTSYDAVRQRYDIYVVNLAQGDARLLRENAGQPAFSPGTSRLAFRNYDPMHLGLGIVDLRNSEYHELTDHVEDSTPAWSPDAEQMLFASNKHGDRKWRIYVISPDVQRGEGEEWAFGQMPAWSPDGSQIAYHGCDEHGDNCGLWLMQPGGFSPTRLTTDASDTAPAWSPDGKQIVFTSTRAGNWELYLVDVASGKVTRLTDHAAADVAPTWSPSGKQVAFLSNRGGGWAVHILDIKSGQVQEVIATGDAYPDPVSERLSWGP
jgi:tetratricopeptide (TPR) repeat protein